MAWYLLSARHSHLASSVWVKPADRVLFPELFCSHHHAYISCLASLYLLPANQCFIKAIQLTNLYRVQDHCPTGWIGSWAVAVHGFNPITRETEVGGSL